MLIGLHLMFGRFLIDAIQRENTYYGLSNRRAIIVTGLFGDRSVLGIATLVSALAGLAQRKVVRRQNN